MRAKDADLVLSLAFGRTKSRDLFCWLVVKGCILGNFHVMQCTGVPLLCFQSRYGSKNFVCHYHDG